MRYMLVMANVSEHITAAAASVGSMAELARRAQCTTQALYKAMRINRVTAEMAVAIETASGNAVTRNDLRPDLWPEQPVVGA